LSFPVLTLWWPKRITYRSLNKSKLITCNFVVNKVPILC
jgi:hypothetical protein